MTTYHVDMSTHMDVFRAVKDRTFPRGRCAWTCIGPEALIPPRYRASQTKAAPIPSVPAHTVFWISPGTGTAILVSNVAASFTPAQVSDMARCIHAAMPISPANPGCRRRNADAIEWRGPCPRGRPDGRGRGAAGAGKILRMQVLIRAVRGL
ncbi:hypothetical protein G6F22_016646 [Rhizopus arrhizus]|nr:hypothetical protein G6F22_016646 [Rhizopus arrhizus]